MSSTKRKTDLKISNLQQIIRKITFATLQTTNMLIHTSAPDNKIMTQQVDSIAMLGHLNTQLAQLRRDEIKPLLKAEYSTICSAEVPISSQYLFGDDLAKQLRDAKEESKISHSFATTSKNGPYRGRHFLWKGQQRPYKKKKITEQRQEIMAQLLQTKSMVSGFTSLLSRLLNYLQNVCATFKAGQAVAHFAAWRTLPNDKALLSNVLGASIACTATPCPI